MPGLLLAGTWTDTGWPATLESAVLSGHAAAAEALGDSASSRAAACPRRTAAGAPALAGTGAS